MKSTISLDEYLRQSLINFNRIDNEVLSKTSRLRSPMLNQSDINNDSTLESNPLPNSLNNCERKKTKKKNSLDLSITSKSYQYRLESSHNKIKELNRNMNNFTFHPLINKKSTRLADNLEPSNQRIRTKRKKYYKSSNSSFVSEYQHSPYANRLNSSVGNRTEAFYLYEKTKRSQERKKIQKDFEEKKKISQEQEELKKMFKPTLYKKSNNNLITHHRPNNSMYLINKERNTIKKEMLYQYNEGKQCTFKPMLYITNISNDESLIKSQIPYINDYVNERRKQITTSKEKSNKIRATSRQYIVNYAKIDKKRKKPIRHINTPERLKEQRKTMGTSLFYE